jgi:hypothetical protein
VHTLIARGGTYAHNHWRCRARGSRRQPLAADVESEAAVEFVLSTCLSAMEDLANVEKIAQAPWIFGGKSGAQVTALATTLAECLVYPR